MSKCQKNKYFIGSFGTYKKDTCGVSQEYSKILSSRAALDMQMAAPAAATHAPTSAPHANSLTIRAVKPAKSDIDIILGGDSF